MQKATPVFFRAASGIHVKHTCIFYDANTISNKAVVLYKRACKRHQSVYGFLLHVTFSAIKQKTKCRVDIEVILTE